MPRPRPNVYQVGTDSEIVLATVDTQGLIVVPAEARLTIDPPHAETFTVSGSAMTNNGVYLSYIYPVTASGFYRYEGWIRDDSGREVVGVNGFHGVDHL